MTAELPSFTPAVGCVAQPAPLTVGLDAPGRIIVRRFDCGDGPVTLIVEVMSARSIASRLVAEQRRLTGRFDGDDVETQSLSAPNSPPGAWRLMEAAKSGRAVATSLWLDGRPTQLGLGARARQAWRSVFGARFQPVLIVVTADTDDPVRDAAGRRQAASRIAGFVQAQPTLADLAGRLAGVTD
jgi:hypothetical protein